MLDFVRSMDIMDRRHLNKHPTMTCFAKLNHHHHHTHTHTSASLLSIPNCEGRSGTTDDFTTSFLHFPCSPLPSGTWRAPGLSIPWCCLPTSSSVCLVFFLLSLCLARWFWPDLMNVKHDHITAVCVVSSGNTSFPWLVFFFGALIFMWNVLQFV